VTFGILVFVVVVEPDEEEEDIPSPFRDDLGVARTVDPE
jgi:hypothetical protein